MTNDTPDEPRDDQPRVAEVLAQLRAGVLQRQAELATISDDLKELPTALAHAHRVQYVEEPQCVSHRPVVGRFIIAVKKIAYLPMKWYLQDILRHQNEFNRAANLALRDLFERQKVLVRELQEMREKLDAARAPDGGEIP